MKKYGNCLLSVMQTKKDLAPKFYKIFQKNTSVKYDSSNLLKLDPNSWDFFIESLEFFKRFLKDILLNQYNPFLKASIVDIYTLILTYIPDWAENISVEYFNSLILFSKKIKAKEIEHYYIESESLFKFLTSIEVKNIKDMMDYIKSLETESGAFAFHFPDDTGFTILLFFKKDTLLGYAENKDGIFILPQYEDKIIDFINRNNGIKICFNAIAYTKCFTENVIKGVPSDCKNKPAKSENPKTLTPFKEIENFSQKEISAHFRHAHFRFCGSDYFKSKKGKWVFVKGSMVNAEAKTIIEED